MTQRVNSKEKITLEEFKKKIKTLTKLYLMNFHDKNGVYNNYGPREKMSES